MVTWNVGSLAYGATASLGLTVQAGAAGTLTNSAIVTSATPDPNPDDNSASVTTTVIPPTADLALAMADSPDPVLLGYNLTYTLTVNNLGPATASGVTLVDTLPPTVSFVSASPGNAFARVGQVVTFNLGNLGSNGQTTATIVVQPTALGTPLNSAVCSSTVTDPFKANNHASVKTIVQQVPLTLASVKGGLEISWPASFNYILQSTTNLHPPAVWMPVTDIMPVQTNGQMVVVVPIGPGNQFFRLAYSPVPALPLSVSRAGSNLKLAWPTNSWNASLESAASLRMPVVWNPVTSPLPSVVGGQNTLTLPIGGGPQYFRLHGTAP
jgi:uncharacterized repeat protein (TIGR01451 family)